jgi:hypothetical protein
MVSVAGLAPARAALKERTLGLLCIHGAAGAKQRGVVVELLLRGADVLRGEEPLQLGDFAGALVFQFECLGEFHGWDPF